MKKLQAWMKAPRHKYAINAALLGDYRNCAWSNLGLWQTDQLNYPQACELLAITLAQSIDLNSKDKLIDLGCGQGASLILWKEKFQIEYLEGIELQEYYVNHTRKFLPHVNRISQGTFLNLESRSFEFKFDAAICIDAAYHSNLNLFLRSVDGILNSKGRLAFHYLALNSKFYTLSPLAQLKVKLLLKAADVQLNHLHSFDEMQSILVQTGFRDIHIQDLSHEVFAGFATYIQSDIFKNNIQAHSYHVLDLAKIKMTAKLCAKLYQEGIVRYVQVSASKK